MKLGSETSIKVYICDMEKNQPDSVNAYIGKTSPELPSANKPEVIETNELPWCGPRLTGFPCKDSELVPKLNWVLGDVIVQNFKCFFPAVKMDLESDEKETDEMAVQDELALSFVSNIVLRQSQIYMYPPTDTRYFPGINKEQRIIYDGKRKSE